MSRDRLCFKVSQLMSMYVFLSVVSVRQCNPILILVLILVLVLVLVLILVLVLQLHNSSGHGDFSYVSQQPRHARQERVRRGVFNRQILIQIILALNSPDLHFEADSEFSACGSTLTSFFSSPCALNKKVSALLFFLMRTTRMVGKQSEVSVVCCLME